MAQEQIRKQPGLLELLDEWEKQGASDAEITQRMNRYLDSKARKEGVPIHGTFELTPLCNLDCKMCYVHLSEKQLRESGKRLLTVDEWKDIMQQAIDAGMMSATLTGGECLTYPGFEEIYLFLQSKGIEVHIKTNGVLLTPEMVDFFCANIPREIQISLYGADEETYEKVTGHRNFAQVMRAIRDLEDRRLPLVINVTPNRFMAQNSEQLVYLLESLKSPYHINLALFQPRAETGRDGTNLDMSIDDYFKMYHINAELTGNSLQPICSDDIPCPSRNAEPISGLPCGSGRNTFAVYWTGMLHPCLMFNKVGENLKETPFSTAWKKIHNFVQTYPFPGECIGCEYQKLCPVCVVQHEMGGEQGKHNPAFCERAKRLVAEGFAVRTVRKENNYEEDIRTTCGQENSV